MSQPTAPIYPSMESPDGKLRWAKRHAETFKEQVTITAKADRHRITVEDDPNASQYVFKVFGLQPADPDWGYLFGDCIHNLRTALDHLVLQLAILGQGGRELTDDEARSTSFPLYDDPTRFPDPSKSGPIRLLRSGEKTRITELQPFNAWDASIWGNSPHVPFGRSGEAWVPSMLRRLADFGQHRQAPGGTSNVAECSMVGR